MTSKVDAVALAYIERERVEAERKAVCLSWIHSERAKARAAREVSVYHSERVARILGCYSPGH